MTLSKKSFWASDLEAASSTWVWGVTNSLVGLIIGFLAPILGAYSDIGRFRKKLLGFFVLLGVLSTGYLYFIQQGEWFLAVLFYSLISRPAKSRTQQYLVSILFQNSPPNS